MVRRKNLKSLLTPTIITDRDKTMIQRIITWSLNNPVRVLICSVILFLWGLYAIAYTPIDAIPDLSDVQVIIKTPYSGRSPKVIEEQITYPLTTAMMSVPGAKVVRGYSYFGDSFVYILFEPGTDLYWARSRVLEYLNQAISKLPSGVKPELGPDATGVGWVYEYALVDRTGKHDIAQLRSLQDWFLKFELRFVPGVAEVATIGGMVKEYQIILDPTILKGLELSLNTIVDRIKSSNNAGGGSVLELAESEYILRTNGFLTSLKDVEYIPISQSKDGTPIFLKDIARIQLGPELRRGIAELNGEGAVVGGVIVMRSGKNPLQTIEGVKSKLEDLKSGLPKGVEIIPTYDRSAVIERAIHNLFVKLGEESLAVALVCLAFLLHLRSALVVIIPLPLGILAAFLVMYYQGVTANIMSLGGIAIAIGAMVDVAVVLVENSHKQLEHWHKEHPGVQPTHLEYLELLRQGTTQVGPPLFFSLLIITISFLPIFALQGQEGLLFSPLAYTKTYAMAAAAGLSVTLVPALMILFLQKDLPREETNPINRWLISLYHKAITPVLNFPKITISLAGVLLVMTLYPLLRIGSEFMPPLQEGDLLYMPSTFPNISIGKATQVLQQTDKLINQFPEVKNVFGKMGRADTATDPAPLEMLETTIQLKDQNQWRPGMTPEKLIQELDEKVKLPGLTNLWVQPIRNRIEMLSTGIKGTLGLKISGPDLKVIESLGRNIENLLNKLPGTRSVYAERLEGGRYLDISIDRRLAARYGLTIDDIQMAINSAIGGEPITQSVEGLERYPVNIRFPLDWRDSIEKIRQFPIMTPTKALVSLESVAKIELAPGPTMLRLENARPTGLVYIDVQNTDIGSYVSQAKDLLQDQLKLPPGYSVTWSGQYEAMKRANERMLFIVPLTLVSISFLLYAIFRRWLEPFLILISLPFALIGGFWLVYGLGFNLSVAVDVGFIALAGIAAEFGVVLLLYLKMALKHRQDMNQLNTLEDLRQAIIEGAVMRVRPKSMTVAIILAGLFPILIGQGTGSDVMKRIAAPMLGGMITAPLLSMFVIPALYYLWYSRKFRE